MAHKLLLAKFENDNLDSVIDVTDQPLDAINEGLAHGGQWHGHALAIAEVNEAGHITEAIAVLDSAQMTDIGLTIFNTVEMITA